MTRSEQELYIYNFWIYKYNSEMLNEYKDQVTVDNLSWFQLWAKNSSSNIELFKEQLSIMPQDFIDELVNAIDYITNIIFRITYESFVSKKDFYNLHDCIGDGQRYFDINEDEFHRDLKATFHDDPSNLVSQLRFKRIANTI